MPFHPHLKTQLRRAGYLTEPDTTVDLRLSSLLTQIDAAYVASDSDQAFNERATGLASREMAALQAALSAERDTLESRVAQRTDELLASERRLLRLLRMSSDWYWECDPKFHLTQVSAGFQRITGFSPESALGKRPADFWANSVSVSPDGELFKQSSKRRAFEDMPVQITHRDGHIIELLVSGEPIFDSEGLLTGWSGVIHDVTQERSAQRELEVRSLTDPLTELGNRLRFKSDVLKLIDSDTSFVLTLIDLDRFKSINDAEGHHAGDQFLIEIASRLRTGARANESVYRLSGDEFVVVSIGGGETELERVVAGTLGLIRPDNAADNVSLRVFASAGSARYPEDAQTFDGLLIAADVAMYTAKRQGGHRHFAYSQSLHIEWQQRAMLTQSLRRALDDDLMDFHYQPIFGSGGVAVVGFEALLRWHACPTPAFGPLEIVNYAEEHGLAPLLTRWSLRRVAKDYAALTVDWPNSYISINVTPLQAADPLLPNLIRELFVAAPRLADRLLIELTEGPTVIPEASLNEALINVVNSGASVALDDFGSGMSSLQRLLALPLTRLKLDRFLVQGIEHDQPRLAFVQAMVALAHAHRLKVIAEGVETNAELETLCSIGVDEFQGFLLGRPAPP
ncbi:MAG: EAL domain-containing protein [Betaproteobacteria bacterium]|nr:MAG: EAL domain-containing protein [Betaproteobacteria bacterium]TAG46528.1 MAG: EAL domain-containing protein [Betaproteobacteria bacterium]